MQYHDPPPMAPLGVARWVGTSQQNEHPWEAGDPAGESEMSRTGGRGTVDGRKPHILFVLLIFESVWGPRAFGSWSDPPEGPLSILPDGGRST